MKVLHVIGSVDPKGGGPIEGVFSSSAVWHKYGHERHIVSLDSPSDRCLETARVPTTAIGFDGRFYKFLLKHLPWLRYGYTPRLKPWLRANAANYDAVIINGLWNYASYGAWRALHNMKHPYFVFAHGMLDPWFNRQYPIKTFFKMLFWKLFEHKVLRDARGVIFTATLERDLARTSFKPYNAKEYVIGYGTNDILGDPEAYRKAFLARVPEVTGRKFILFLSRIHPKKGVDILIQAFAHAARCFPGLDLVVAGPDQDGYKASLQKIAIDLGIADRIHWPGMLQGDDKWGAYLSSEFFVLPSHQENFGIVLAEAMALGRPVLTTKGTNIWHEIGDDKAGLIVEDTYDGILAGLQQMCSFSSDQMNELGTNARNCFLTRYNLETNALELLNLVERHSKH